MSQSARTPDTASSGPVTETTVRPLLLLSAVLLTGWSIWALFIRPRLPVGSAPVESVMGIAERTVFWLVPCGVYLWKYWGPRWHQPLGLDFPLGAPQVVRTVVLTLFVAGLLFLGTAAQRNMATLQLLLLFFDRARLDLLSPLFEELVFRGLLVGELLNWVRDASTTSIGLRLRFWGSLVLSAFVFVAMHWPGWLVHFGLVAIIERTGSVFVTGLVLGFVFAHTRSVWACVLLHWVNNQLSQIG